MSEHHPKHVRILFVILFLLGNTSLAEARPASAGPDGDLFTLQVATFAASEQAAELSRKVPDAWIQEIRQEGRVLYRVNYKKFSDRGMAIRAQWHLEDLGYKSFVQKLYT